MLAAMALVSLLVSFEGGIAVAEDGSGEGPYRWPSIAAYREATRVTVKEQLVGVNFATWWHEEFLYPESDDALENLASTGANTAAFVVTQYMSSCTTSQIDAIEWTATDESIVHAITTAQAEGLIVGLKLHIDVLDDNCGRHSIQPADRAAWHRNYHDVAMHYAQLAADHGVAYYIIGAELDSMSVDSLAWRLLIRDIRAIYDGELTYAANPEEFQMIRFWDALDYIGIDAYFELTTQLNPSTAGFRLGWVRWRDPHTRATQNWVAQIEQVQRRYAKPVLFTEAGYRAIEGTGIAPASCEVPGREDVAQQARAYQALFDVWGRKDYWAGVLFWAWAPVPDGKGCTSEFSPQHKPAAGVIQRYMETQAVAARD